MKIKKLSVKMQIALNLLFLLIMVPLILVVFFTLQKDIERQSKERLITSTNMVYEMTSLYIDGAIKNRLRGIAEKSKEFVAYNYDLYRQGVLSEEEAYQRSKDLLLSPDYGKIGETGYLAGVSSKGVLVIHPKSEGVDASGADFMKRAIAMKNGYLEYDWQNTGEEEARAKAGYMSFFSPWDLIIWASSYKTEFESLLDLEKLCANLNEVRFGKTGYVFIFDSDGNVVYHPGINEGRYLEQNSAKVSDELLAVSEEVSVDPSEPHELMYNSRMKDGNRKRIGAFRYFPLMDWIIVSSSEIGEVFSIVTTIRGIMIVGLLLAFLAMNGVIFVVFRSMLNPIRRIKEVVDEVAAGKVDTVIDVTTEDEIGTISVELNKLIRSFQDVLKSMKQDVTVLNSSIQDLTTSSKEISTTSNEQAAAVKEIVSTMEDSDSLAKSIEKKIEEVTKIALETKSTVDKGVGTVDLNRTKMEEIKVSNSDTISGIRSLGEKIEAIWEIVNIINSIADQTKIIAFNAELEASAAGDAGKNFQIVASEIRRLADSTVSSTSEIKTKIDEIQHSSDNLIIASEEGTEKIEEGTNLTKELFSTFQEILETSEISAKSAGDINLSIKQQVSAFEQILQTLKQISEGINNFATSTKSTTDISQNLKNMSDTMQSSLSKFVIPEEEQIQDERE
jgi:methyl-accepting chemotaxis protein